MDINIFIDDLIDRIRKISTRNSHLGSIGEQAIKAISTSRRRAVSQERGLSYAARLSIAAAGLRFVASVADELINRDSRAVFRMCTGMVPPFNPDHEEDMEQGFELPAEWKGEGKGPFKRSLGTKILTIVRRPKLPGGDWTLCVNGVPFIFDKDPYSLASRAEALIPQLDS